MTRTSSLTEETVASGPPSRVKTITGSQGPTTGLHIGQDLSEKINDIPDTQQQNRDFGILPIPRHLRYDPVKPFHFGLVLNIAFAFISTFSTFLPIYIFTS